MIKEIGNNIEVVEGWTDPGGRRPLAPQPPVNIRRPSPPRRHEAPPREISSRKLMQRFTFQFRSLLRIVDGEVGMDSATTDQAESMYKTLESMRQSLDKFEDVDAEKINIDGIDYDVNEKMENWIRFTYRRIRTEKKRKKKKRLNLRNEKDCCRCPLHFQPKWRMMQVCLASFATC